MGTSNSFPGPGNNTPLVPDWLEPDDPPTPRNARRSATTLSYPTPNEEPRRTPKPLTAEPQPEPETPPASPPATHHHPIASRQPERTCLDLQVQVAVTRALA